MTNFTIDTANLEAQIAYGSGHISVPVSVVGFWSNPIDLRIRREFAWGKEGNVGNWTFEVSHSSGGKDTKEVDVLVSERNFAEAILASLDLVESLKARTAELEAAYQARMAETERLIAAERAAKEAKVAADPAIGAEAARAYVDALIANARQVNGPSSRMLRAKVRGAESVIEFVATRNWTGKVTLRIGGDASSRKDAIEQLANLAFAGLVPDVALTDDELLRWNR